MRLTLGMSEKDCGSKVSMHFRHNEWLHGTKVTGISVKAAEQRRQTYIIL